VVGERESEEQQGWGVGTVKEVRGCIAFGMSMQKRVCGSLIIHWGHQL